MGFAGKKVAVLGLGIEGLSTVEWLQKQGADITILDQKTEDQLAGNVGEKITSWKLEPILGPKYLDSLDQFDVIVRSPGIRPDLPPLLAAAKKGVKITSQTKLFFDLCQAPIIGVTGTKGKGTTATLIYEILKAVGKKVFLGGNIGRPPLDFLDDVTGDSWVILELSSFQLMDLTKSPHIGVVLMVTSEHLDWHKNTQEYLSAKEPVVSYQTNNDFAVIAQDYPNSMYYASQTRGQVFIFSRLAKVDHGVWVEKDSFWYSDGDIKQKIMPIGGVALPGRHNWDNVAAAICVAKILSIDNKVIGRAIANFKGLEHRLEKVAEVAGVTYYNDSFSTTPETTIAAIAAFDRPEILILGGSSKGSDFRKLGQVIKNSQNVKAIIGIGVEWPTIKKAVSSQLPAISFIEDCKDMKQVVQAASKIAQPGDVVLLSPACASFDMFKNYKIRGEQFKEEVLSLKKIKS
ncbi:UDP-N-acetylmuramoyl-L-alanine--D-glutamate ligase [Candidatus Daviesbacteria bacterium]|nr:UDP-N-acetylmuramoyl-L-alanine--D-glutamate ligase [Candidatus Daviesbacteria bacterium]